jgi:DNA primase
MGALRLRAVFVRRDPPLDLRRAADEVRDRYSLSTIVGRRTTLRRSGRQMVGLCVFHQERTPSLHVNDAAGFYHCFGCGAGGDAIRFVMASEGLRFIEALRWLGAADLPAIDPTQRALAAAEDAAERATAIAEARAVWNNAAPAAGTPAETYVQARGITTPLPPSIRFARTYAWRDRETGEVGPNLPALIGAVVDAAGDVTGIQRIFLADGGRAKARMRNPKRTLGRVLGGALRLGPPAAELIVCEGPEDGLTLAQELPGASVWAALGTSMMPAVQYPPEVRSIVLAGDNNAAGRGAVDAAALALTDAGYAVRTMYPAEGFADFNDMHRGIRL